MNKHEIIGNLVRDPETGTTESGVNWCQFTVAARKRFHKEGEPDAEFVRVTVWRGLAESCAKYLAKGRKVYCSGEPKPHAWMGKDNQPKAQIELTANEVEFLSGGNGAQKPSDDDAPPAPRGAEETEETTDPESGFTQVETDELPF